VRQAASGILLKRIITTGVATVLLVLCFAPPSDGHTTSDTDTATVSNVQEPPPPSGYPASFFTGPAGTNNPLPSGGYPFMHSWFGETPANDLFGTSSSQQIQSFQFRESQIGRQMNIIHNWQQARCSLDMASVNEYRAEGVVVLDWEPSPVHYDQILAGQADNCIVAVAQQLATITSGNPVILRMYHEWNGDWMAWSCSSAAGSNCGFSSPAHISTDQTKQVWQRTVDKLREGGAFANGKVAVDLDWHEGFYGPGNDGFIEANAYPGDAYVDWISSTSYSEGQSEWCGPTTQHLCELAETMTHGQCISPPFPEIQQTGYSCSSSKIPQGVEADYRGRKPYLLAETGLGHPAADDWAGSWMRYAGAYISAHQPGLGAVTYFDFDPRQFGETLNWRVDSSSSKLQGFKDWGALPRFN
jgi:hypothetical protein